MSGRLRSLLLSAARRGVARPAAARRPLSSVAPIAMTFRRADGSAIPAEAQDGDTLLDVAQDNGVDEVEGACGGECACSTCHVILGDALFAALPPAGEDELDMLDLAVGVTPTSRLGCQVRVTRELFEGAEVRLPDEVLNLYVDN